MEFRQDIEAGPTGSFCIAQGQHHFTPELLSRSFIAEIGHMSGQVKSLGDDVILETKIHWRTDERALDKERNATKR